MSAVWWVFSIMIQNVMQFSHSFVKYFYFVRSFWFKLSTLSFFDVIKFVVFIETGIDCIMHVKKKTLFCPFVVIKCHLEWLSIEWQHNNFHKKKPHIWFKILFTFYWVLPIEICLLFFSLWKSFCIFFFCYFFIFHKKMFAKNRFEYRFLVLFVFFFFFQCFAFEPYLHTRIHFSPFYLSFSSLQFIRILVSFWCGCKFLGNFVVIFC